MNGKRKRRAAKKAKALAALPGKRQEREIIRDFREHVREWLYYHLGEEDFHIVLRSRHYKKALAALDGEEVKRKWEARCFGIDLLERIFWQPETHYVAECAQDDESRWEAYLERIAPRTLRNAKPNPWEEGYDGRFWPWREKMAWLHRKKKGVVVRNTETKGKTRRKLCKVTLHGRCDPGWADYPLLLFTEDIEEFQRRWFPLEEAWWRHRCLLGASEENKHFQSIKEKFLRSKGGEVVCLYCDKPEYNIVQVAAATIYAEKTFMLEDAWFTHTSFFHYLKHFHVDRWTIRFRWLAFRGQYYRTASYRAEGVCQLALEPKRLWQVEAEDIDNAVYEISSPYAPRKEYQPKDDTPMRDSSFQDFAQNTVASIADTHVYFFDSESKLLADAESFTVTEKIMTHLFLDIAGM